VLKLMLMPAVVLAAAWALGLPPLAAKVAVATASMPTGVNSYLIAVQFRTGQGLASSQLTLSSVAAVATTVFWLAVAHAVFG
jgi:predicted permease